MTAFAYTAINAQGLVTKGVLHAADPVSAKDQLRQQGLLARSLSEQKTASAGSARFAKIKPKSLQIFSRQFATLIQAGVSIVQALLILEEQTDDKKLSVVIAEIREDVESGVVLSTRNVSAPEGVQPPLRRDDRGGRGIGNTRHRPRPHRDPDREGDEAQAAGEERDDLPERRAHVRDARPDRDADVPRPDLRGDLPAAERATAHDHADRRERVERAP